jgi:hypothetical protein
MNIIINKGIVKKNVEGELHPYILKDFNGGIEFPLSEMAMKVHKMQEGDLVEFAGRVQGECIYLAIAGVDFRASLN